MNTIKELDKLYGCRNATVEIVLDRKTVYDINGNLKGHLILTDGVFEIKEPIDMNVSRFMELKQALENIFDERNGWKRLFNAFASTKLTPLNCNKSETKKAYGISMEEFLLDIDIECLYLESEIRDYEDLGKELVDVEDLNIPVELENHIDYASYGHEWNMSESIEPIGIMTRWGFLYYSEHGSNF
jgi:hypothetical protein